MADNDKVIEIALGRFKMAQDATNDFRKQAQEDLKFCSEDQWDPATRQARESSGRPCMQIDRINPAIRQVVNESRQNRPSIEIDPTGDGADVDTANVFSGLVRHIEYDSNADNAYDTASEYAIKTGLGYFRLVTDYEGDQSFDQRLLIKPLYDPSCVFIDPFHREMDGSDMEWGFIVEDIPTEDFERTYPQSDTVKFSSAAGGWSNLDSPAPGWVTADSVRVAEYFFKEYTTKTLYQLYNTFTGMTTVELESKDIQKGLKDGTLKELKKRPTQVCQVKWLKITGLEVLEETVWPSQYIPIFPVKGEEFWVNGERFTCGMVRRARDAQRALNYLRSAQIEAVDLAPKAPFIGVAGQFDTFEDDWRDANRKNIAYLEYNSVDVNGNPAGAPQRSSVEPAIQAIMATGGSAIDDIKAITGVFDASLGNQSNEESGVAIIARKEQTSNANFHYYDNLVRAIKHCGRVLVEVVPTFYDTERTIRIVKANGEQELKTINSMMGDGKTTKPIDFSTGKYDVIVKTGPTYQTKRQRLVEQGTAIIKQYPQAGPLIADLLVSASDFEGADVIAARLRTQVPPEVLAATGEGQDGADPKQQVGQLTMANQQLQQQLQQLNAHCQEMESKAKDLDEEVKLMKLAQKADMTKAQMDYDIKAKQLQLDEATTELEFLVKEREFALQQQQMELNKAQVAVKATQAAAGVADSMHQREMDWLDNSRDKTIHTISEVKPLPEVKIGSDTDPDLGGKFGHGELSMDN